MFGVWTGDSIARDDEPKKIPEDPPYKRLLKGDDAKKVAELEKKNNDLEKAGRFTEAQETARQVLAIRTRVQGAEHWETMNAQWNLKTFTKVASLSAAAQEEWRTLADLVQKAEQLRQKGRYAEAEPLYREALEIRRRLLGEDHPYTAQSYNNFAMNLDAHGKYAEAEPLYREALEIRRRLLGEDHPYTGQSYNNVAMNMKAQGKYAEAERLFRKALEIRRRVLGEDHPYTAQSYNNVACNLNDQGKYAEAEPLLRKALEILRRVLGEEHRFTATSYNNAAMNMKAQGKYAEAEPLSRKALEIRRRLLGEEHPDVAEGFNNLAATLNAEGKYAEAEPLLRKSLEILRRLLGEDHPYTAQSYNNVACNLNDQGKYAEAEPFLRKALEILRRVLGEEHPDTARSYNNMAYNLNAQGKYAEAEASWTGAARSYEVARLRSNPTGLERSSFGLRTNPIPALVACLARNGKPIQADQYLEASLARGLLDEISSRQAQALTPEQGDRRLTLSARLDQLDKQIANVLASKDTSEARQAKLQKLTEERKQPEAELGQLAAELAAREVYDLKRIQEQLPADGALVAWVDIKGRPQAADPNGEHWACVLRQQWKPIWVKLPGSGKGNGWTEDDDKLPGRFREALAGPTLTSDKELRYLTARLTDQRLKPLEGMLDAITELPAVRHLIVVPVWAMAGVPVEALTDRYTVSYIPSGTLWARLQEERRKNPAHDEKNLRLLALGDPVFTRKPEPTLPAPPDHGLLIAQLVPGSNAAKSGLRLGDVLLQYGDKKLAKPEDLSPVPAIMHNAGAEGQTRGKEGIGVEVWREGKVLSLAVTPGPLGIGFTRGTAAEAMKAKREGDPALRGGPRKDYQPLPGTRAEVEAIARLFPQPLVLLGSEASAERLAGLTKELVQYHYLHFATHGEVDQRVAYNSALVLAQDHLADQAVGGSLADGRLRAAEMAKGWKLNADLVVLSACQSGLGRGGGGEGFLGFTQALFFAGARSLVVSLWKVDDTATALLMERFYQNLLGKRAGVSSPMPKAEALWEAKQWLRALSVENAQKRIAALPPTARGERIKVPPSGSAKPYEHPYYWSAFILIGDPN
jgi:CHAT domain-containing protein